MSYVFLPAAALAAAGLAFASIANVPAAAEQPTGLQFAQAQSYSEEKLQSFALAVVNVQQIQEQYMVEMQRAESEAERQQMAEGITEETVNAVESQPGITVEEYNEIMRAAGEDPALRERINEYINLLSR